MKIIAIISFIRLFVSELIIMLGDEEVFVFRKLTINILYFYLSLVKTKIEIVILFIVFF
jgi:hypothetical protein